jgi:hypothetical protein
MALRATTIDEVVDIMDHIVHDCMSKNDRLGFFASLYRTTTIVVRQRCNEGFFEDNDRMRYLDVVFANRYFEAYDAHCNGTGKPTDSWQVSFDAARKGNLIILQHLLLGMNAHISLDLGIATADVANGKLTPSLERDFNRLNNILAGLIDRVQEEVGRVSPLLRVLDSLAWRTDETFISYSINTARDSAWKFAEDLVMCPEHEREEAILERDRKVATFARIIGGNRWYIAPLLWVVSMSESKDARHIVQQLSNETWVTNAQHHIDRIIQHAKDRGVDLSEWKSAREQIRETTEMHVIQG